MFIYLFTYLILIYLIFVHSDIIYLLISDVYYLSNVVKFLLIC